MPPLPARLLVPALILALFLAPLLAPPLVALVVAAADDAEKALLCEPLPPLVVRVLGDRLVLRRPREDGGKGQAECHAYKSVCNF